jgi:UDP-glucose 4-epimerase
MDLTGKRILVTGGTGSLGQVLVRRLLSGERGTPKKIVVLSRDEAKQHEMRLSYQHLEGSTDEVIYHNFSRLLEFRIGDVRSYADVCGAVRDADIVFNAAALKQVPVCEYFPEQAVLTNCMGAVNVIQAIRDLDVPVETVVGISTDKACKPVNVMGMTKAIAERAFIAANVLNPRTRFVCVRYGNVLASRGSVIPLFHQQIKKGGPVTVTAPTMTRFLMTLEQAVDTVFEAVAHAAPGEIIIPRAPSANVMDIARALVESRPVEIKVTEVRPGEKEHEILVSEEECRHTFTHGDYYVIAPMLPELRKHRVQSDPPLNREYSSADAPGTFDETVSLLRTHRLMVNTDQTSAAELLR